MDAFLAALAPASGEATLTALRETEQAWHRELHQRELLVERARYESERAERQFTRVEPEQAREVTRQRISLGIVQRGEPGRRKAMPYFFAVLCDLVEDERSAAAHPSVEGRVE